MTSTVLAYPQRSVTGPHGSVVFGDIPEAVATAVQCRSGAVRLLNGFQGRDGSGFGLDHMTAKLARVRNLANLGFTSIPAFVRFVACDYDVIGDAGSDRLALVRQCSGHPLHLIVEWRVERNFWSVVTGLPKRALPDVILWEKPRTDRSEPRSSSAVSHRFATLSLPKGPAGKGS